jgi:hypothetical protein
MDFGINDGRALYSFISHLRACILVFARVGGRKSSDLRELGCDRLCCSVSVRMCLEGCLSVACHGVHLLTEQVKIRVVGEETGGRSWFLQGFAAQRLGLQTLAIGPANPESQNHLSCRINWITAYRNPTTNKHHTGVLACKQKERQQAVMLDEA